MDDKTAYCVDRKYSEEACRMNTCRWHIIQFAMKWKESLVAILFCLATFAVFSYIAHRRAVGTHDYHIDSITAQHVAAHHGDALRKLTDVALVQNSTIVALRLALELEQDALAAMRKHVEKHGKVKSDTLEEKCPSLTHHSSATKEEYFMSSTVSSDIESECEERYGDTLLHNWKASRQLWCSSVEKLDSSITCYPYHQKHKQLDGRSPDMFCEATNLFIDFSKVSGSVAADKPAKGTQYLSFAARSTFSACKKTQHYRDQLFMPHHSLQVSDSF